MHKPERLSINTFNFKAGKAALQERDHHHPISLVSVALKLVHTNLTRYEIFY